MSARFDPFFRQLEVAHRAAAAPLATDPEVALRFATACRALLVHVEEGASADELDTAFWRSIDELVGATIRAAPPFALLMGPYLVAQMVALVAYRVAEHRDGADRARLVYEQLVPRQVARRPDLRALREAIGMPHPMGRTPGYELVDAEDLLGRIRAAGDDLARDWPITQARVARHMGVDEKTLRTWIRQNHLGEPRAVIAAERMRHKQRLRRARDR